MDIVKGQSVYVMSRNGVDKEEGKVVSVGPRYVTVEFGGFKYQFYCHNLLERKSWGYSRKLLLSSDEVEPETKWSLYQKKVGEGHFWENGKKISKEHYWENWGQYTLEELCKYATEHWDDKEDDEEDELTNCPVCNECGQEVRRTNTTIHMVCQCGEMWDLVILK